LYDLRRDAVGDKEERNDAYYFFSMLLLAFGFFPGIGRSHQAICGTLSNEIAVGGFVALLLTGLALSLIVDRKSILISCALSGVFLGFNRCVTVPILEIYWALTLAILIFWRWIPKGRTRMPSIAEPAS
jgi:hypothetical protein